ncbi:hypothetical protein ICN84_10865 [Akkermansia glycaniphila]|uniref:hypothetical protein n=1 Tax=Akkermansia glycaniphila TaxID=1679444 RepID=UPI001C017A1F|nr:hypothetical protein [Akkermansia glycaniphila]MBT9450568.1 hypothetical protein [Akkermansia glycaniphila]
MGFLCFPSARPFILFLWARTGIVRKTLYHAHGLRNNLISLFVGKGLHLASCQYDSFGCITSMEGDTAENCSCRFFAEHHDPCFGLVSSNYNLTDCRRASCGPIVEKK